MHYVGKLDEASMMSNCINNEVPPLAKFCLFAFTMFYNFISWAGKALAHALSGNK